MPFTPKDWKDYPLLDTPLSAAAMEDIEARLSAYTDARLAGWASFVLASKVMTTAISVDAASYDSVSNRTFYVYRGPKGDYYVGYFDHALGQAATGVKVGDFDDLDPNVSTSDGHGVASIALDGDGYVHVLATPHDSRMGWYKSASPRSIDGTWTLTLGGTAGATSWPVGTYTNVCYEPVSNALWCLYRSGTYGSHGTDAYPGHPRGALIKLPNGASGSSAWVDMNPGADGGIIDTLGYPGVATTDFYMPVISAYPGGKLLMTWTVAIGSVHDGVRVNVYAAIYDPATDHVYSVSGTDVGTQVEFSDAADRAAVEVYHADDGTELPGDPNTVNNINHYVDQSNGDILIVFPRRIDDTQAAIRVSKWANGAWTHVDTGIRHYSLVNGATMAIRKREDGVFEMIGTYFQHSGGAATAGKDLVVWTSPDGLTWTKEQTLVRAREVCGLWVEGICIPQPSHRGLKALWHPFGSSFYHADVELCGVSNEDVSPSELAGRLWRAFKWGYFSRDTASVVTDSSPPAPGVKKEIDWSAGSNFGKTTAIWLEIKFAGTATDVYFSLRPSYAYDPVPPAGRWDVRAYLPKQASGAVTPVEPLRVPLNPDGKFEYQYAVGAGAVTSVTFSIVGFESH